MAKTHFENLTTKSNSEMNAIRKYYDMFRQSQEDDTEHDHWQMLQIALPPVQRRRRKKYRA